MSMSDAQPPRRKKRAPSRAPAPPSWKDRVEYARDHDGGFFYRPKQVIARDAPGQTALNYLEAINGIGTVTEVLTTTAKNHLFEFGGAVSVLKVVADLKDDGFKAEPNYVLFAHGLSGNPLSGNPLYGNPLYGNPLYGNPLYGNPLYGNPLYGNPLYGNPLYGDPLGYGVKLTGPQMNTAQPVADPKPAARRWNQARGAPAVFILDSGLAGAGTTGVPGQRPDLLKQNASNLGVKQSGWGALSAKPAGYTADAGDDLPDSAPEDKALDPIAGHGTFIAGVIELLAPGRQMEVIKVFEIEGDVDVAKIAWCLDQLVANDKTLINLSFGGYAPSEMFTLRGAIRNVQAKGAVVVASAGNDGTWRRAYPACLPGVIGVGALGPFGPALFTNYGPWVRACAPGTEIVSSFFQIWDGPLPGPSTKIDPDRFRGWARWSGTSFAAPVVVAALAREMTTTGCTANQAVERVIDAPGLLRIPGLGTVINIAP